MIQRHSLVGRSSPWGTIDNASNVADGIDWVSTPSHGGFVISQARWIEFRAKFPAFKTWAGNQGFEEDCDWAAVVAMWPDLFTSEQCNSALSTILGSRDYFKDIAAWVDTDDAIPFKTKASTMVAA